MGLKLLALRRAAAAAKCGAVCDGGGVALRLSRLCCNASRLEKLTHKLMMAF